MAAMKDMGSPLSMPLANLINEVKSQFTGKNCKNKNKNK
jgi:hypothetical protein